MEKIRLLIVDDDAQICKSIKIILSKDEQIETVGFANNGEEAISKFFELRPDLVLMDIQMPVMSGIEASSEILSKDADAKILLLSTFSDEEYIVKAFQIGVRGYIIKQEYKKIAPAIKSVINGQFVFADEVISTLPKFIMQFKSMGKSNRSLDQQGNSAVRADVQTAAQARNPQQQQSRDQAHSQSQGRYESDSSFSQMQKDCAESLSEKEQKILELVASGLTNKEIAEELHFSAGTIRNNISALLEKLDLKNRTQLASFYSEYLDHHLK